VESTRRLEGSVARLLLQHRTALYGYIYACVRDHADTADILQNVSMAVTESIGELRTEDGFLPWAREIARRRVLAHHRKSARERAVDPELAQRLAEAAERVEQDRPASDRHAALLECLKDLPPASRRLILRRYDGSVADIGELARRAGRTIQAVYAQIKRTKLALRQCVERRLAAESGS
jgi:RNA polymerase sigma-70 factor (ECF subfamily)